MAQQNSISNNSSELTLDPGSSGDSFIQFDINTTGEYRIGVDDTDDSFRISQGSVLGTNDYYIVDADGIRTLPSQPSFLNIINAEANVSGDGTVHDVGEVTATTSIADRNSDMTEGDGAGTGATFTAPVAGFYQFNFGLQVDIDGTDGGTEMVIAIATTSRTFNVTLYPTENKVTDLFGLDGDLAFTGTCFEDMAASDTAVFRFTSSNDAKTDDIIDGYISGSLMM